MVTCFSDLFNLQTMTPDPLQQVTETGDQGVLLHARDANLAVTQLHGLPTHLLYQHTFRLQTNKGDALLSLVRTSNIPQICC